MAIVSIGSWHAPVTHAGLIRNALEYSTISVYMVNLTKVSDLDGQGLSDLESQVRSPSQRQGAKKKTG